MKNNLESYSDDQSGNTKEKLFYNIYNIPLHIEHEGLSISVTHKGDSLHYHRVYGGEKLEKIILTANGNILFNPVEPINKPKEITPFFLIQFEQSLTIKPRETNDVMVTFPVEIACILVAEEQNYNVLDIFAMAEQKYSLYGTPKSGLICRYWKSHVHTAAPPSPNPLREGVMRLSIRNTTPRWIEVTQAVFSANEMKIYYDYKGAYVNAYMKLLSETTAETGFNNTPPENRLEKSLELLASRKMIMSEPKQLMEEGL